MNKNMTPIILIIVLVLGCKKELKENETAWNPYSKNEVIVFESSAKELDTIAINEIVDNAISSSPAPELYRHTSLIVYGRRLKLKDSKFSKNSILEITSSTPDKPAKVTFPLNFDNANFAGWGFKIEDLEKYPKISITTKAGIFNDVIKIESVMYRPEREDEVQFMYWSEKNGYIKFERADGFTWELIKKYVP